MGDFCGFFFSVKGCEAERCLWQTQRGEARAKQRETKLCKGFDYVLPMGKKVHQKNPEIKRIVSCKKKGHRFLLASM